MSGAFWSTAAKVDTASDTLMRGLIALELEEEEDDASSEDGGIESDSPDEPLDHDTLKDRRRRTKAIADNPDSALVEAARSRFTYRWERKPIRLFHKKNMAWPPLTTRESMADIWPNIMDLSQREFEILLFLGILTEHRNMGHVAVDLSQSIERCYVPESFSLGCITPGGRLWSTLRMRLLTGSAKLRAQRFFQQRAGGYP